MATIKELEHLLDEYKAAKLECAKPLPVSEVQFCRREARLQHVRERLRDVATPDTLQALVEIAQVAQEHILAWDATEEAISERDEALYGASHGQVLSEQYHAELVSAVRKANAVEHCTADALRTALAVLVGEEKVLVCDTPQQERSYTSFAEAAKTDAPDGATVLVNGREYEVVRTIHSVTRDAIVVTPVAVWQRGEGCEIHALTTGSYVHALAAGSRAYADVAGSRVHALAAGSIAYAKVKGSYAHADVVGSTAYAEVIGSRAHAWVAGSIAYAYNGGKAYANVAGSYAYAYKGGDVYALDGGTAYALAAGSYAHALDGGTAYPYTGVDDE